jgi:hypothetical protein
VSTSTGPSEFVRAMGPVARAILGEPTEENKTKRELRFGTRGSLCVSLDKGTWHDHEQGKGGGVIDFVQERKSLDKDGAIGWLQDQGHITKPQTSNSKLGRVAATYDYLGAGGSLLFQVVRFEPKDFRQRQPDGNGGWLWKVPSGLRVPYRLPAVIAAIAAGRTTVYICEGEKAVHAIESLGLIGTCSPGGAGKWRAAYNPHFAGADVVILPDNDPQATTPEGEPRWHPDGRPVLPGQDHAADVARNLSRVARSVRVVMLPDLPLKGDVHDWVASGGTAEAFAALVDALGADAPAGGNDEPDDGWDIDAEDARLKAEARAEGIGPEPPPGFDDPGYQAAVDADPQAPKPTIEVIAGKIAKTTTIAEQALIDSGIPLYQRGQSLVRPAMQEVPASKGRLTIAACFAKLSRPGAVDIMARSAEWTRFDGRSRRWVKIDPPPAIADVLLSRFGEWTFPTVKGVITTPTLRPDYSILCEPGYDAATRLYLMPDKTLVMPDIQERPTKEQAAEAIELLDALLIGFPFVSEVDRSVALSALITPVCRGAMAVSPLHAFRANTAGTGKSLSPMSPAPSHPAAHAPSFRQAATWMRWTSGWLGCCFQGPLFSASTTSMAVSAQICSARPPSAPCYGCGALVSRTSSKLRATPPYSPTETASLSKVT